jgi:hypothetical protein
MFLFHFGCKSTKNSKHVALNSQLSTLNSKLFYIFAPQSALSVTYNVINSEP